MMTAMMRIVNAVRCNLPNSVNLRVNDSDVQTVNWSYRGHGSSDSLRIVDGRFYDFMRTDRGPATVDNLFKIVKEWVAAVDESFNDPPPSRRSCKVVYVPGEIADLADEELGKVLSVLRARFPLLADEIDMDRAWGVDEG